MLLTLACIRTGSMSRMRLMTVTAVHVMLMVVIVKGCGLLGNGVNEEEHDLGLQKSCLVWGEPPVNCTRDT